jgi:hypothetical protein
VENVSEFRVEFLDQAGKVVGQSPLPVLNSSNPPTTNHLIRTLVEKPAFPFVALRIVRNGRSQIERSIGQNPTSLTSNIDVTRLDNSVLLRWGSPNIPAIVRYTTDQGITWTALAMDWLGGEYHINPGDMPMGSIQFEIIQADSTTSTLSTTWENRNP